MKSRKMSEFKEIERYIPSRGDFRHTIIKVRDISPSPSAGLRGDLSEAYSLSFFAKEYEKGDITAFREVVAYAFCHLISFRQPKVFFVEGEKNDYVFSEEVVEIKLLSDIDPDIIKKNLANGVYTGLGTILILALFLNEVDLKMGNIALDNKNRLIKLDNEESFASLKDPKRELTSVITEEDIDSLPDIFNYKPWNFLDFILQGKKGFTKIFDHENKDNPQLRLDVNSTILRIILLPKAFISAFINSFSTNEKQQSEAKNLSTFLIKRKKALQIEVLNNISFLMYVSNVVPIKRYIDVYINYLATYKIIEKSHLENDIQRRYNKVLRLAKSSSDKILRELKLGDFEAHDILSLPKNPSPYASAWMSSMNLQCMKLYYEKQAQKVVIQKSVKPSASGVFGRSLIELRMNALLHQSSLAADKNKMEMRFNVKP
jgi:hypothetical protein